MPAPPGRPRYRFSGHTLSPARRTLVRDGRELPLIPRCFDLLVLLVERRNEALSRHDILDTVWSDVAVTDGALSQAVRILRRTLGDDPREPSFIRTVPRHGYRFVCDVVEEPDEGPQSVRPAAEPPQPQPHPVGFESLACLPAMFRHMKKNGAHVDDMVMAGTEEALKWANEELKKVFTMSGGELLPQEQSPKDPVRFAQPKDSFTELRAQCFGCWCM